MICRDRAGAYAEGAHDGASDAVQVADRWHLWHNLAEHTAKAVARHRACLKQIAAAADQPQPPREPVAAAAAPAAESRLEARMRDQHAEVQVLAARGMGLRRSPASWAWTARQPAASSTLPPLMRPSPGPSPGPRCWTATSPTCTAGGTRAATTPPYCTPRSPPSATAAACAPSTATCSHSAVAQPRRRSPRQH